MSRAAPSRSGGFTLLELIVALVISTVLLTGMTGAIMVSTRAAEVGAGDATDAVASRDIVDQITRDLHFATGFTRRTDAIVEFTVPDRDGDRMPETISYVWDGVRDVSPGTLTRRYNGGDVTVLAADVEDFRLRYGYRSVGGAPPDTGGGGGIPLMLVVNDATAIGAPDAMRIALLEAWGYAPAPISASASQAALDAGVTAAEVVYVALQNGSQALGTKLRDAAIGIVNEEMALHDEFGFSDGLQWPDPTDTLDIFGPPHHITAPFSGGDLVIYTSSQPVSGMTGGKAPGANVIGRYRSPSNSPSLAAVATGGGLHGGGFAAGRRVLLPWGRTGFDVGALNDNGRTILARAIDWANSGGPQPPQNLGYDTAFPTPVSGVEKIQIATQATLSESGSVTSISAYVGGAVKKLRYAVYSDSGGEPNTLLVESAVDSSAVADEWITIPIPETPLAAGDYWLALSFERSQQHYYQQAPGQTRYLNYDARKWGFQPSWTVSDDSFAIAISIYATYTPD